MKESAVLSLYRYYLLMRHMQSRFLHELGSGNWHEIAAKNPDFLPFLLRIDPPAAFLDLWQATLFVVVEGWVKLGLANPKIDALLQSPNVESLKLHRHGTFHFHADITPPVYRHLLSSSDGVQWTHQLADGFRAFFEAYRATPEFEAAARTCDVKSP